jgi:hypothetical protein
MARAALLAATLSLASCGPPEDPGEWAAIGASSVATDRGFLYGFGQFEPRRGQRGAFGVLVIDAEALFIRDEALAVPTRDLARAQVREWNTDPVGFVGGGTGGLFALVDGALQRAAPAGFKQPVAAAPGVALPHPMERIDAHSTGVSLLTLSDGVVAAVGVLRHEDSSLVTGAVSGRPCAPLATGPGELVLALSSCQAGAALQLLTASDTAVTAGPVRALPQVGFASGVGVAGGRVVVGDRGTTPALHVYGLGAADVTFERTLTLDEAPQSLRGVGGRLLVFTSSKALLIDLDAAGATASVLSQQDVAPVADLTPYTSPAEPGGTFFALAHGNRGLSLLEVRGDVLVHRGGFHHRWSDQPISLLGATKY